MSSLITSTLEKLSFRMNFARGPKTFDLISLKCKDTLKELTLSRYSGDKEVLKKVFKSLLKLQVLNLEDAYIDDGVLAIVGSHCSELRKLSVKSCHNITDVSMEYLFVKESTEDGLNSYGKCKMIESLNIRHARISEIGVETVLRNAPNLKNLDYPDVCLVLGEMHGEDLESQSPLVQYSLTTLHAADYRKWSFTKSLSIAIGACPGVTDVYLDIDRKNDERDVLRPLCQLKNLKNLDLKTFRGHLEDSFSKVVPVLSASGQSITRLRLIAFPSADVSIIGVCCPLLEDFCLHIRGILGYVQCREETFIPTANNRRPFAFLKFLRFSMTFPNSGMRDNSDIRPSGWKDLLSSRLLESLSIAESSSLTDSLLSEVLKEGQEFPNLRKIELLNCPNITAGFVKLFLHLPNPLEAITVMFCKNIHKSDLDPLKSLCKVNHFDVDISISSGDWIDLFSDSESDEDDFFLY